MDFFRSLFQRVEKKSIVEDINRKNTNISHLETVEISIDESPLQISGNSNETHGILGNSVTDMTTDPLLLEDETDLTDANKVIFTMENVSPVKISNTYPEPKVIDKVLNMANDIEILNNNITYNTEDNTIINGLSDSQNDEACEGLITIMNNKETNIIVDVNNAVSKEPEMSTLNNSIDNETLKNLIEFEDTLKKFEKITHAADDNEKEFIDLDEFNEMVGELELCRETNNSDIKIEEIKDTNMTSDSQNDSNNLEDIDIISIMSSNEAKSQSFDINDIVFINSDGEAHSDSDGYNSSDFEFISETEANKDGFINNIDHDARQDADNISLSSSEPLSNYRINKKYCNVETEKEIDSGEGPSGVNKQKNQYVDRSYRNNHVIPEGEDYFGLFRGIYNPLMPVCEIYFLENKSVRASAMNVQYDGIGFDKQLVHRKYKPDSSEDEFEEDAKKCAERILNMYPGENRKRRRRY